MKIRAIEKQELPQLLELYRHLHADEPVLAPADAEPVWEQILTDPNLLYFAAEVEGRLVSACTLTIVPNLTRAARPYGLIENVVTHSTYRRRGLATAVLQHALNVAWERNCYKVMLLTGSKDESTLHFYEGAGLQRGVKTGFIAYPHD